MALKYVNKQKHKITLGTKEIEFYAWTAKEEKSYLELIEKKDKISIDDKIIYDTLIKPCLIDKNLVLSSAQQKLVIIEIRKVSISDKFKDTIVCTNEKCKHSEEREILITDVIKYKSTSWSPIEVQDMKFVLGDLKSNKDKNKLSLDKGIINYIYNDFMLHIQSITIDNEEQTDFTFKELTDFMESLPSKIFDEIFEKYQEQIDTLEIELKTKCTKCNTEITKKYENIPGLLWI